MRRGLRVGGAVWAVTLLVCTGRAAALDFYVDPLSGADAGSGSKSQPWRTLQAVVDAGHVGSEIHAGDTLWLLSGYHGELSVDGGTYADPITIATAPGQTPRVSHASFRNAHGFVVRGLSISPSHAPSPVVQTMVTIDDASSDIVIEGCELFSVDDAASWGVDEWINAASSGVQVSGDHVTISHNALRNVRFGISVDGPNARIEHNEIVGFSADGLRGLGDYGAFEYNVVKNVYVDDAAGDANHDDGFQSWSVGAGGVGTGVVKGVVLRGNVFINREDPNQALSNSMQGIGCFDGFFEDWIVENNVVATDHWHGISFYGMRNSRIVNNTVIDVNDVDPGPPWIMVTAHKDMTPSENVIVRNNLAMDYMLSGNAITDDHNTKLAPTDLTAYFVDPTTFDLRLLPSAPAVDTGSAEEAPALDADRIARPQGNGVDLGAYEWHDASVTAAGDAGASDAGASNAGPVDSGGTETGSIGVGGGTGGGGASGGGGEGADTVDAGSGAGGGTASRTPNGCSCELARASRSTPWVWLLLPVIAWRMGRRRA